MSNNNALLMAEEGGNNASDEKMSAVLRVELGEMSSSSSTEQQQQHLPQSVSMTSQPPQYQPPATQNIINGTIAQPYGITYNAATQQLTPLLCADSNNNSTRANNDGKVEPSEAAVSRPLSIISIFCWLQIWFAIPAIIFAFKRNKPRSNYNLSIALSVTAIVLGICLSFGFAVYFLLPLKNLQFAGKHG